MVQGKTNAIHVGNERFSRLTKLAIELSYALGIQITPSQFAQRLIDEYGERAKNDWSSHRGETDKET